MSLEKALNKASEKIKESIGVNPTVLWTGNGYHIYQPVSGPVLEEYETFYGMLHGKYFSFFDMMIVCDNGSYLFYCNQYKPCLGYLMSFR
jgi:hypothetical protein